MNAWVHCHYKAPIDFPSPIPVLHLIRIVDLSRSRIFTKTNRKYQVQLFCTTHTENQCWKSTLCPPQYLHHGDCPSETQFRVPPTPLCFAGASCNQSFSFMTSSISHVSSPSYFSNNIV